MKRPVLLVALAALAAYAAEPKYGIIVEGLLPRADAPSPFEPSLGIGAMVALEARFDLDEKIAIAPFVGFEYISHGVEAEEDGVEAEMSLKSKFIPIGTSFQLAVTPALKVALTPEIDLSMGGTGKLTVKSEGETVLESDEEDIDGEESPFLLGFGIVYGTTDKAALLLGYKLAVGEYLEEYTLHKFYVGGRFSM